MKIKLPLLLLFNNLSTGMSAMMAATRTSMHTTTRSTTSTFTKRSGGTSSSSTTSLAAGAAKKIFCFGDSLTAGTSPPSPQNHPYGSYLQNQLRTIPGFESSLVRWKGYPGWTSSQLLEQGGLHGILDNIQATAGSIDILLILAGTNDLAYESDCDVLFNSIVGIHELVHDCTKGSGCKTVALGIPPSGWQVQSDSARILAERVNSKLESWAQSQSKVDNVGDGDGDRGQLVSFVPFPIQEFDRSSGFWSPDGLHFSPEGYKFIGESLAPSVADMLGSNANANEQ